MPSTISQAINDPLEMIIRKREVKIAPQPFAEGAERLAYHMLEQKHGNLRLVGKEFKFLGSRKNSKANYLLQMEIQTIAARLAHSFNMAYPSEEPIKFLLTKCMHFMNRSKPIYFSAEPLILGDYVKYSNNAGWVNNKIDSELFNTFSHWTWAATNGYLIIVDLQGVNNLLTDPAIHCTDLLKFGDMNLGQEGMKQFFKNHKCSDKCREFGLGPVDADSLAEL
eukprot:TRINITY_DN1123_c0_g1_i4.p1 TRINITY_DN1123_c0_g1~~TRINITY_DN1123_c0_g1_i4.p1  ORF type:complete len:223 (+),score=21.43 TRINITY_DN1123_c0_g1_i4:327-995(+)